MAWAVRFRVDPRLYFYMTREYQQANWDRIGRSITGNDSYLSFSPIIPNKILNSSCNVLLIIDMTLNQYLKYEHFGTVPKRVAEEIFQSEKLSYARADRIFAATDVTREQLVTLYNIPRNKIEVIGRGVNLPLELPSRSESQESNDAPLRIGFVGHDYKRKGLPILIEAIEASPQLDGKIVLNAIGPTESDIKAQPWMRLHGYISKEDALERYVEILSASDIGYLFSQSESIPGSVLEFLCLGVPCLISDIPEMQSIRDLPGIVSVPLSAGLHGIKQAILDLTVSREKIVELKKLAAENTFREWHRQAEQVASWCR